MKKIFENAVWWSGVVMVGLILGLTIQFVKAWTEPTQAPPDGNVGAPINTGLIEQLKQGALGINGLLKAYGGLQIPTGAGVGKVLTSDATGMVAWGAGGGGGTPIGAIMPYAGSTAPAGFFLCDGASYSRATYASLAAVIGGGGENFQVPDLKGKTIVGYNSAENEFNALNKTGGEKKHVLTISEMPSHTHTNSAAANNNGGGVTEGGGASNGPWVYYNGSSGSNGNTGGGAAHNNLQPYTTLNYIIKY